MHAQSLSDVRSVAQAQHIIAAAQAGSGSTVPWSAAVRGLLESDRHARYIQASALPTYLQPHQSSLTAPDADFTMRNGWVVITRVWGESRNVLKPGDVITHINGQQLSRYALGQFLNQWYGNQAQTVAVTVAGADQNIFLHRHDGTSKPVPESTTVADTLIIRIPSLRADTADSVQRLIAQNMPVDSLVLDLRGVTDGSLQAALGVGDHFAHDGVLLQVNPWRGHPMTHHASTAELIADARILVVVDQFTSGPAEWLAQMLKQHRNACVMGSRTAGQSQPLSMETLSSGDAIVFSAGSISLDAKTPISATGLIPDVPLPDNVDLNHSHLERCDGSR